MNRRRVALITGAGSGIGRACAVALLNAGYAVVLAGRRHEALEETRSVATRTARSRSLVVPTDVTDAESVRALFAATRKAFGRLDLLFNNAGINVPAAPADEVPLENWRAVIETNLTGAFLCAQEAFRMMKRQRPQGGRIVNNGSISAHVPRPHSAPYTAAKHGITGLTKSLALDGRRYNIPCGQIDIGNAATPLTRRMKKGVLQPDGSLAPEATMDVKHVADALLYLAALPLDVNVPNLTVMAGRMPYAGRG